MDPYILSSLSAKVWSLLREQTHQDNSNDTPQPMRELQASKIVLWMVLPVTEVPWVIPAAMFTSRAVMKTMQSMIDFDDKKKS